MKRHFRAPVRVSILLMPIALISGCGLAGTATSTATGAAAEAQAARDAKAIEERAQQQIDEAQRASAARAEDAEKDAR